MSAESGSQRRTLTTPGVAKRFGVTSGTVYGLMGRGLIPVQKVGGRYAWDEAALTALRQALGVGMGREEGPLEEPIGWTTEEARNHLGVDYGTLMSLLHPLRKKIVLPQSSRGRVILTPEVMEQVKDVLRTRVEVDERRIASRRTELERRMRQLLLDCEAGAEELFGPDLPQAKAALGTLGVRFRELVGAARELAEPAAMVTYITSVPDRRYEVVFPVPVFVYRLHARFRAVLVETELEVVGESPHKAVRLLRKLLWKKFCEEPTEDLRDLIVEACRRTPDGGRPGKK